jgi:tetratricopeptide (TPR) repeat protein
MEYLILAVVALGAVAAAVLLARRRRSGSARIEQMRIDALLAAGDYQQAAAAVEALLGGSPPRLRTDLGVRLAMALAGQELYEEAIAAGGAALAAATDERARATAILATARCQALWGDFEGARSSLAGLAHPFGDLAVERMLVNADLLLVRYRLDEAEQTLGEAYRCATGLAGDEVALQHARLQYLRGNFRQAVAELLRILPRLGHADMLADALTLLALAELELGDDPTEIDRAISTAQQAVRQPGRAAVAEACYALCQAHFGNVDEAIAAAKRAPAMTCSRRFEADVHCLIGEALLRLARFDEARTSFQRALALDQRRLEALWGLGACAQSNGMFEVAETYFRLCMETAPEHFLAYRAETQIGV